MKKQLLTLILIPVLTAAYSQAITGPDCDEGEIVRATERFFHGMNTGDTSVLRSLMHPECRMSGVAKDVRVRPGSAFVRMIGQIAPGSIEERIGSIEVRCDGEVATARMYYRFLIGDSISHCGENYFQWLRSPAGWQVIAVADTRRAGPCPPTAREEIDALLDDWHRAAAEADADRYFGAMSADGIFLGTDASERWVRDTFRAWASLYFERGRAWSFRPYDRYIDFSEDGNTAWFDEKLDTWMDVSRGSGVLTRTDEGWKIRQYNLAVLVPNDKVHDYLAVLAGEDPAGLYFSASVTKLEHSRDYTLKVAELMPEEQYGFRPKEEMMSFRRQLIHMADNLEWLSSQYLGADFVPIEGRDIGEVSKDSVISIVKRAYDRAIGTFETFDPANMKDTVDFFAGPMTKLQIMQLVHDHQTHHRAQLLVYLRLEGIEPPRYVGW